MIAFHGKKSIKTHYVNQIKAHVKADELVQGYGYWQDGKWCAVGCTLHSANHAGRQSMDTKWTPGPWCYGTQYDCHTQIKAGAIYIARTECSKLDKENYVYGDVERANAALICAAPALYNALTALKNAVDYDEGVIEALEDAEDALKGARGE